MKAAQAQADEINRQSEKQADELQDKATLESNERLRAKRREDAQIRVAAGASGLNLASGSIEAFLQDSAMQTEMDLTTISKNNDSAQQERISQTKSRLSQIKMPTALGAGLQIAKAGYSGYQAGMKLTGGFNTENVLKGAKQAAKSAGAT